MRYKHVLMFVCPLIVAAFLIGLAGENIVTRKSCPEYEPAETPSGAREAWVLHRAAACLLLDEQEAS